MSKIIYKNNNINNSITYSNDLELGELAINTNDGKLFIKKNDNTIKNIEDVIDNRLFKINSSNIINTSNINFNKATSQVLSYFNCATIGLNVVCDYDLYQNI